MNSIIILLITVIILYCYKPYSSFSLYEIKSTIDNNNYLVKKHENKNDEVKNANKLASIKEKINILIKSLSKDSENRKLLEEAPLILQERNNDKEIGYTINKGQSIGLCLRDNDNALFFIVLHELAHVITKEYGHTKEFWKNFEELIKKSIDLGIYNYKDYNSNPINYCDYEIKYTPYKK